MRYIALVIALYFCSFTALYAQDFSVELMKCRAHLDIVIEKAGPKYNEIKAQADAFNKTIEKLREEMVDAEISDKATTEWEVSFGRKIVCVEISIRALGLEIDKYLLKDILIKGIV